MVVESRVCSVPVVVVKEDEEVGSADAGVLVSASVSPFPERGLDKAFGFTIGAGSIRASEEVAQSKSLATQGKEF